MYALFLFNMVVLSSGSNQRLKSQRETYKSAVRPHGWHIHNTASEMSMETMFPCSYLHHALSHCKCLLCCCVKCPIIIIIPSQEANRNAKNTCPTIYFHVYVHVSRFILHDRRPYK